MSQKFSEPVSNRRRVTGDSLPAVWAAYSAKVLPKNWSKDQKAAAEIFFFTGAAFAVQLLVTKPEVSGGSKVEARSVLNDLVVWVKRRKKALGFYV